MIYGISLGSVYALISVGFALIFNVLKFSNFSHGGVMVTCAYLGYVIAQNLHTNLAVTLILTSMIGGCIAVGIEFIGFRRLRKKKADALIYFVSTVTIGTLLGNIVTIFFGGGYYSYPSFFGTSPYFSLFGINVAKTDAMMLIISLAALFVIIFILQRTKLGIAIRAISTDAQTTNLMGVNATMVITATFFVSGVLGGLAGVFLGINNTLTPQLGNLVVKGFMASVLGGLGSISGAIIGAFLIALIETFSASVGFIGAGFAPVVMFLAVLVFLLVRPQGILGKSALDKA